MYNSHNNDHINMLAALIAKNNAGEQEAIEGYARLLGTEGFPQAFYSDIREIISDEMNHSQKLTHWFTALTGIVAAKD